MAKYTNISSATTVTLITKNTSVSGGVSKINIANHDGSDANTIILFLYDGTNTYVIAETVIPAQATLVLEDKETLSFDNKIFDLKITTSSTADTTVIIN